MKEHVLTTEGRDGGVDWYDVTFCVDCGAYQSYFGSDYFYPGTGIRLPHDCVESSKIIETHKQDQIERVKKAVEYWSNAPIEQDVIKVPLHQYLSWSEQQLTDYLSTGHPPYYCNFSYENKPARLFQCNHKCPSCCFENKYD